MTGWARAALAAVAEGRPAALVTIMATEGSAPREAGARMLVTRETISGTVGGGALEHQLTRQARAALDQPPGTWRVQDYALGPLLGQCCGGRVRVLVERLDPASAQWLEDVASGSARGLSARFEPEAVFRAVGADGEPALARGPAPKAGDVIIEAAADAVQTVLIFGAGHVGRALLRALEPLPFAAEALDGRPEMAGRATILDEAGMMAGIRGAGPDSILLIMTHDHALDFRLTLAALQSRAGFVGLIGSRTKRARFLSRLRREGLSDPDLARLVCPIGLPEIMGKDPDVIAVSVAAQLLARRSRP